MHCSKLCPCVVLAGSSGPDPDVFAEYAVFAERAGLSSFQAKWEAVLIDDWEIARQSRGTLQLPSRWP